MQYHITPQPPIPERLLILKEVEARVSLRQSYIYELMRRTPPEFPAPLKISRKAVRWTESSISGWIEDRIKASQIQS